MIDKEIVITTEIAWQKGYVYFVKKDDKGNIMVLRAKPTGRPKVPKGYKLIREG